MNPFSRAGEVLISPTAAGEVLGSYPCANAVEVVRTNQKLAVFLVDLRPYPELAAAGYPTERVRISVWRDGRIMAIPEPDGRSWQHRNVSVLGELCLWYPDDPRGLRWEWADGLLAYLVVVHRHLQAEEFARRNDGAWPVEEAPHGGGDRPHPIRTWTMRIAGGAR